MIIRLKGGPGSGHHGHAGRPGKRGGSLPGKGGGGAVKRLRGYGKQHNVYVLRYTPDVEGDIERGWSGWMDVNDESLEDLMTYYLGVDPEDLEYKWDMWQDPTHNPWHHRDYDDYQEFLLDYASDAGLDIRQDPRTGLWVSVHHEGLSAFALDASSSDEAVSKAQEWLSSDSPPGIGGWKGVATVGDVEPVAELGGGWYILGAQGYEDEDY